MSTRATIHFNWQDKTQAIVYRHSDGYPEGLGKDLQIFLEYLKEWVPDNRFSDPGYLAAKWVVWDALKAERSKFHEAREPLAFLGVGIRMDDPSDINYRYTIHCEFSDPDTGLPGVSCEEVYAQGHASFPTRIGGKNAD